VLADVNGDGKLDVVGMHYSINSIRVLLGVGNGTFAGAVLTSPLGFYASDIAVADVNRDGKPDVLATNIESSDVAVLLGTGTGSFSGPNYFSVAPGTRRVLVGDLNRDGNPDLVVRYYSFGDGGVSVLLGNGAGVFGGSMLVMDDFNGEIALADLDNDGNVDLVGTEFIIFEGARLFVRRGTGTGTFHGPLTKATPEFSDTLRMGDVNNDGNLDVVVATYSTAAVGSYTYV